MILINQIITDIRIESVNDLYKLKPFLEDGTLKINKSQIARELEVDRRTVDKYINGYAKPETRNCDDCITPFYDIITELLSDKNHDYKWKNFLCDGAEEHNAVGTFKKDRDCNK